MHTLHEHLQEVDDSIILWKYMSLAKFITLLVDNCLWFNRIDNFEDVFEGSYPRANERLRPELYKTETIPKEHYSLIEKQGKKSLFVSCFHANDYESAAMWKLYSKDEGIAIQTTAENLKKAFSVEKRNIYITPVKYIDYEKDFLPEGNMMYLATHKRKSFIHENEVRCVYFDHYASRTLKDSIGFNAKTDLEELIQKVYISPYAQPFMKHVISDVLQKYGLSIETIYSNLYTISI